MIALSSSFKEALIAVDINGKQGYKKLDANCKHSENILLNIDNILDQIDEDINNNDIFAVVIGPGSFTGIRIGIALVKGFKAANDSFKLLPLTTFDLMAYSYIKNNKVDENFYCVINALSNKYFICEYDKDGNKKGNEKLVEQDEYDNIKETKISLLEENLTDKTVDITSEELLALAKKQAEKGNFVNENELIPMYLRKSQAEVSLEEKKVKNS